MVRRKPVRDRIGGLVLCPESNQRIRHQQDQNDEKVGPVVQESG
jgi:hypothetical protein